MERVQQAIDTQHRIIENMRETELKFAQLNQRMSAQFQDGQQRKIEAHVKLLNNIRADVEQIFIRIG